MAHPTSMAKNDIQESFAGKEYKRLGYSLFIALSGDKMECRCSYVPRRQGAMMTRDELCAFLAQSDIKTGIDAEELDRFAGKTGAGQMVRDALLACGIPPINGSDGFFSPTAQPSIVAHHEEDGDSHDFRNVQTFINVRPGDEIGRIIPREMGIPGRRVTGEVVVPKHGRPLKIRIGKNIRVEDDGTRLVAEAEGRVCTRFGEMSVEQEYRIDGDVDFRVGSIDFNGVVDVRGDVLDGFNIAASKGLCVKGNIGNGNIISDGDILLCGMDGQNKGSIICGGTIRANYIHDCTIECAGDVIVDVEIHNCTIWSLGRIIVNKGAIAGGSYTALGGIEARRFGTLSSLHTRLTVGVDYRDLLVLDQLHADLAQNHEQITTSTDLKEVEQLRMVRAALTDRVMAIRSKIDAGSNPKINAKAALYENVLLTVGFLSQQIYEQVDGPVSITENTIECRLRYTPMTGLDINARDMEQAFIRVFQ